LTFDYLRDEDAIVTLTIDQPARPVNTLSSAFVSAFATILERLTAESGLRGVILTSAKADFMAGADIDELYACREVAQAMAMADAFKRAGRRFETLGVSTVAALNGTALGGGLELALCCHHRIALDIATARFGFPEVTLGLFPGGGGSQRLPRLVGLQPALPLLLEGATYRPAAAQERGLVDALAPDREAMMGLARDWIEAHPQAAQPWDRKGFRWPGDGPDHPRTAQMWSLAPAVLKKRSRGNLPHTEQALAAIYEGSLVDFDTACRIESRYFAKTICSSTARNMMTACWYQRNQVERGAGRPAGVPPSKAARVAVLGAGMMGAGIAQIAADAGFEVVLLDVSRARAEQGKAVVQQALTKQLAGGQRSQEQTAAALSRLRPTATFGDLADCDFVIEAVFEDRDLKAEVIRRAEAVTAESTIFASNTSTLPITGLAKAASRPAHFIGLHFFSPVARMPLVEIIPGAQTSPETLARAFDFVRHLRKTPILVNDSRGFYTSRVFGTYVKEGVALLVEGQAPRAIESAGLQAGMPLGPLAVSDEISLSLMHRIRKQTQQDLEAEGRTPPAHPADAAIAAMIEHRRHGRKAGGGFYDYSPAGDKTLWPGLAELFPVARVALDQAVMIERLMFAQALETVRCLQEGVLNSVADANIGSILGWGFPSFKGGTLQYINDYGVAAFSERARTLGDAYGLRFEPPALLLDMARKHAEFL